MSLFDTGERVYGTGDRVFETGERDRGASVVEVYTISSFETLKFLPRPF
jgi:hypothetical protein